MNLKNSIPGKAKSFPDLLQSVTRKPASERNPIFRTAYETGYFSDGVVLFTLKRQEQEQLDKIHWDAIAVDYEFSVSTLYDLKEFLPKYLSKGAFTAKHVGGTEKHDVVLVEGDGLEVLVEAVPFLTLHKFLCPLSV